MSQLLSVVILVAIRSVALSIEASQGVLFINKQVDYQSDRLNRWKDRCFSGLRSKIFAALSMFEKESHAECYTKVPSHIAVPSYLEELASVQQWFRSVISQLAQKTPLVNDQFDQLNLALAEGFTNAVRHAHAGLPRDTPIEIELVLQPQQIEICIFDQGGPFDPTSLSEPKPGSLSEGGYGWFLLRRLADQVTYKRTALSRVTESGRKSRNCLRIVKTLAKP